MLLRRNSIHASRRDFLFYIENLSDLCYNKYNIFLIIFEGETL